MLRWLGSGMEPWAQRGALLRVRVGSRSYNQLNIFRTSPSLRVTLLELSPYPQGVLAIMLGWTFRCAVRPGAGRTIHAAGSDHLR